MTDSRFNHITTNDPISFLGLSNIPLSEKAMATHSGTLAWKIPWTEEPGGLHAVHGVARVGQD